jgi:hypothetical protein
VKARRIFAIALLIASAPSALGASPTLLEKLAEQLQHARQLPEGSATRYHCPEHTAELIGIAKQSVEDALGKPDYIGNERDWSYFFTSPRPPTQLGGGFPELTFYFDKSDKTSRVTCYLSR